MSESNRTKRMSEVWDSLVKTSKHRSRYFFHTMSAEGETKTHADILDLLRTLASTEDLRISITPDTNIFRARICDGTCRPSKESELWAPPPEKISAGRMNPAGISYLYLANEQATALAEIYATPPCEIAVAQFRPTKTLTLLNLCKPPPPDMYGEGVVGDAYRFLEYFIDTITLPVVKDGREHIDYVPSQIVCEYFAYAHTMSGKSAVWPQLHGMQYPSTVRDGGKNIVLFPSAAESYGDFGKLIAKANLNIVPIETWKDFEKETRSLSNAQ